VIDFKLSGNILNGICDLCDVSEQILETCNDREDLRNAARKIVEEELGAQGDDQGAR
jgi:hypothetical protein